MKLPTFLTTTFKSISSLQIAESSNVNPQFERMSCPILKSIMTTEDTPHLQQDKMHIKETPFLSVLLKRLMLSGKSKTSAKESDS